MAKLDVRVFGDPVLRQKAREVDSFDEPLARLAADMLETMREHNGVGLAANQVGVLKRLFTWEVEEWGDGDGDEPVAVHGGAVVNPRLVDASEDDLVEDDEGCLSFPGLFYPVKRPLLVRIEYQDLEGEEHSVDLEGFFARIFLHEMDHLDGILFIDHLAQHDRKEAMRRMRVHREEHGLDEPAARPGGLGLFGGLR